MSGNMSYDTSAQSAASFKLPSISLESAILKAPRETITGLL